MAELRETIETLKTQNTDAQTAIQVALNGPDHLHKGNEETSWDPLILDPTSVKSYDVLRRHFLA